MTYNAARLSAIRRKNDRFRELDALQLQALKLKHARLPIPDELTERIDAAERAYALALGECDAYRVLAPKAKHAALI